MRTVKPKKRQKLCHHCEGEVDLDVIVCPFCAADLREEKPELYKNSFSPAVSSVKQINTEHSLYPPIYAQTHEREEEPRVIPVVAPVAAQANEDVAKPPTISWKMTLLSVSLISVGAHLLLLGLILFFFSDQGTLLLRWNANLWPFYTIASLPLLAFGCRMLKNYFSD